MLWDCETDAPAGGPLGSRRITVAATVTVRTNNVERVDGDAVVSVSVDVWVPRQDAYVLLTAGGARPYIVTKLPVPRFLPSMNSIAHGTVDRVDRVLMLAILLL